jgi:hypothetical protein
MDFGTVQVSEALTGLIIGWWSESQNGPIRLSADDVIDPQDHARFYRDPRHRPHIVHLVEASRNVTWKDFASLRVPEGGESTDFDRLMRAAVFVDFTTADLAERGLHVSRAVSPALLPLTFGTGLLHGLESVGESEGTCSGRSPFPHPFA